MERKTVGGKATVPKKQSSSRDTSAIESALFVSLQLCLLVLLLYWRFQYPPPPGPAVTALALGAAAMSVNEKMGRWKKGAWLFLLAFCAQIELRAISKDRKDQDAHFIKTISTITGGDSYAFLSLRPLGTEGLIYPFLVQSGVNPLHDVKIKIVRISVDGRPSLQTIELPPRDVAIGERNLLNEYPLKTIGHGMDFMIYYDALNGHWAGQECLRFVDGKWLVATKIIRPDDPGGIRGGVTTLFQQVDSGFPSFNGQPDWRPFY